jgi:hypothetical protein
LEEFFSVDGPHSGNKISEKQSKEDLATVGGVQSSPPSSASSMGGGGLNSGNTNQKTLLGTKRLQNIGLLFFYIFFI